VKLHRRPSTLHGVFRIGLDRPQQAKPEAHALAHGHQSRSATRQTEDVQFAVGRKLIDVERARALA